jgi:hypothetical protein
MEKRLLIVLVLLSLLTALIGVAANPMDGGTATLLGVDFVKGKVVFTFKVTGDYTAEDLEGTMVVDGKSYNLSCRKVSHDIVKCKSTKKAANNEVALYWGGAAYTAEVHDFSGPSYCYGVWDWDGDDVWQNYGPHCQDTPAQYGDWITYYNPDWDQNWPVRFEQEGRECAPKAGDAYYYDGCPSEQD